MTAKLSVIETGFFKLDGGAMFGVVPKTLWQKLNAPDENNLCTWAMRCLLLEVDNRKILIDTGLGDKQDAKFRSHFEPHGEDSLMGSLQKMGIGAAEITDVLLTHLHFDHCGGAVARTESGALVPAFPNAKYWSNERHYRWAETPNARERASFLKENFVPLMEHGVLQFLAPEEGLPQMSMLYCYGHTEAMMLPKIEVLGKTVVFTADLIPSEGHINLPNVMAYDMRPLETLKEKEAFLNQAVDEGYILAFEHSPYLEAATLARDERGRFVADRRGTLAELLQV